MLHSSPLKIVASAFLLLCAISGTYLYWSHEQAQITPAILASCFDGVQNGYAKEQTCLQDKVSTLLTKFTPAQILSFVSPATSSPSGVLAFNCHTIGHIVGQEDIKRTGNLEATLAECPQTCDFGCLHGAVGAEVLSELGTEYSADEIVHSDPAKIIAIGKKYCSLSPPLCHAMGHIFGIESGNFRDALTQCDEVSQSPRSEQCYQGVFMETFGGILSFNFSENIIGYHPSDITYPCSEIADRYKRACYFYLPGLLASEAHLTATSPATTNLVLNACNKLSDVSKGYCFEGLGFFNPLAPNGKINVVDESTCVLAPEGTAKDMCLYGLAEKYSTRNRKSDVDSICGSISSASMRSKCSALKTI